MTLTLPEPLRAVAVRFGSLRAVLLIQLGLFLLSSTSWGQAPISQILFEVTKEWKYNDVDNLEKTNWQAVAFDDSLWPSGPGLLHSETNELVAPRNTEIGYVLGKPTYYFRTHFNLDSKPEGIALIFAANIDDGAVFYLNGTDIQRVRMTPAPAKITYAAFATGTPPTADSDASIQDVFYVSGASLTNLVVGDNVLAVELHQSSATSSDLVFGCSLTLLIDPATRWVIRAGGTALDEGRGVGTDSTGNSYVTGIFGGTATFGITNVLSTNLVSKGGTDVFLAKYNTDGGLIWAQSFGGTGADAVGGIVTDRAGNSLVTGPFAGTITIGGTTLTGATSANSNHFVAKFDSAGNSLWAKQAGGSSSRIAMDGSGNAYVAGQFTGSATIGSFTLTGTNALNVSVSKYDASGNVVWAHVAGANKNPVVAASQSIGIAADPTGNCFVTTTFNTPATFGSLVLSNTTPDDIFVAKYTPSGEVAWVKQITGGIRNQDHGAATDSEGNVFVASSFQKTADFGDVQLTNERQIGLFVVKYDTDGNLYWVQQTPGTNTARSITTDIGGNVYVAGQFTGVSTFGEASYTSIGANDIFVLRYDANSTLAWIRQYGGGQADLGLGTAVDTRGNVSVTGSFLATASFSSKTVTSRSAADVFLVRIVSDTPPGGPTLDVRLAEPNVVISWPKAGADGFILEGTSALEPVAWAAIATAPVPVGDQLEVTVPHSGAARFFRLSK